MKIAQLFILILAFLIIKPAAAGLLIEPVVGYNMGHFDSDTAGVDKEKFSGTSYGGRLGYQNFGFQLGLDYLASSLNVDDNSYSTLKTSEWAGFVGFEFPILLRVYAGYIFSANGDTKYDAGGGLGKQKISLEGGSGTKLGVGFTILPFLDINLEYRKVSFDDYKFAGSKVNDKATYDTVMLGLSLPFVL